MSVAPGTYMHRVWGAGCVYVGCPCVLWDGQEVGGFLSLLLLLLLVVVLFKYSLPKLPRLTLNHSATQAGLEVGFSQTAVCRPVRVAREHQRCYF